MAGCAHRDHVPVQSYESWLRAQFNTPKYAVGAPRSAEDVVYVTDLRNQPERGLSQVHLKSSPGRTYYAYGHQTGRLITPIFSEGVAAVGIPVGRWAYIDETGRFVFPPVFHAANRFDHGVATAMLAQHGPGAVIQQWVLLDRKGSKKALDPSTTLIGNFSGGLAAFSTHDRQIGYIDLAGGIVIPPAFDAVRPFCADGAAAVRKDKLWGLIDRRGNWIVRPDYDGIHCFSEGLAAAKKGKWGFIGPSGTFVVPPQFDDAGDFSEGLASFRSNAGVYGFIDRNGSMVVPPRYGSVYPFHEGIAKAGTRRVDWRIYPLSFLTPADPHYTSWTYIDKRGVVIASGGRD